MALITLQALDYPVGGPLLIEGVTLVIKRGDRICVARGNGASKFTLPRLLDDHPQPTFDSVLGSTSFTAGA